MKGVSLPPGAEFYVERVKRAQALPESERSPEVAAWLRSHDALEAAAPALIDIPDNQVLTTPLGGTAALAAVLQLVAHSLAAVPVYVMLPNLTSGHLAPQLPPLLKVWSVGGNVCDRRQPLLISILRSGLASGAASLELVARLLLLAEHCQGPFVNDPGLSCSVLEVLETALSGPAAETRLASELSHLQGQLAGASSSGAGPLPTVEELQAVRHNLSLGLLPWLSQPNGGTEPLVPERALLLAQRAAHGLATLQPSSPHSALQLGKVAVYRSLNDPSVGARQNELLVEGARHFLRSVQLARQQGSDFLLAWACWNAAAAITTAQDNSMPPTQAAALAQEAAQVYRRCKGVLPPHWQEILKYERGCYLQTQLIVQAHLSRSPDAWQPGLSSQQMLQQEEAGLQGESASARALPACDACGMFTVGLRRCAGCKVKLYCSRACQVRDWKEGGHKGECATLAAQRAAGA